MLPKILILIALLAPMKARANDFGPALYVENIIVEGNTRTADDLVFDVLQIQVGQRIRASDNRLVTTRARVLSLGFFLDAEVSLRKGSKPGNVVVVIQVVERGSVVVEKLLFGRSTIHPFWAGLELSELNLFGYGVTGTAGVVFAQGENVDGSDHQFATVLKLGLPRIGRSQWGVGAEFLYVHGAEPFRLSAERTSEPSDYNAFFYKRRDLAGYFTYRPSPLTQLQIGIRSSFIDSQAPSAVVREDKRINLGTLPGASHLATVSAGFTYDNRPNPVLPYTGTAFGIRYEFSRDWLASDYAHQRFDAYVGKWWPISGREHVVSVHARASLFRGNAPRFVQLHESEFNRLATPRVYGLLFSATPPPKFIRDQPIEPFGEVGGSARIEYSYLVFEPTRRIWGGRLFVGAGLWSLGSLANVRSRESGLFEAVPVELTLDAGLRVDTEIGIFEVTIANAFGRLP